MTNKGDRTTTKISNTPRNNGFQPARPAPSTTGIQGGYQGPKSEGAPSNPPSGGSSGRKK